MFRVGNECGECACSTCKRRKICVSGGMPITQYCLSNCRGDCGRPIPIYACKVYTCE